MNKDGMKTKNNRDKAYLLSGVMKGGLQYRVTT